MKILPIKIYNHLTMEWGERSPSASAAKQAAWSPIWVSVKDPWILMLLFSSIDTVE
jgi:hypothetical protein